MRPRTPLPEAQAVQVLARAASTTMLLRDAAAGPEVLMVRRSLTASFMPGAYVFPGGAVDAADAQCAGDEPADALLRRLGEATGVGEQAGAYAVAALRECFEECGLWLGGGGVHQRVAADQERRTHDHERLTADRERLTHDHERLAALRARLHAGVAFAEIARGAGLPLATSALQPWSRWCTPLGLPKRFDTLFFIARAPQGQEPAVDAGETIALEWVHAPSALAAQSDGGFPMEFATLRNLESLAPFATTDALIAHAAQGQRLPLIAPRLQLDAHGHVCGVLLPHEAGYDAAFGAGWGA